MEAEGLCVACLLASALTLEEEPSAEEVRVQQVAGPDGLLAQREFGAYELLQVLGRGGMGVVFRARHKVLGRLVALKVIAAGELASDTARARFRREAEACAVLDHPHIVPIHEIGERDGWPYFAMRLVEGMTLAEWVRREKGQPRRAAELLVTLGRAVHHAHQRGVLHRDLKPENVLLDADGQPHLTDFGLARRFEDDRLTVSHAVLGTPGFLAPEQAAGDWARITTATDVHGLGALLYFLLTGRAPFEGSTTAETLTRVMGHDAPPLRTVDRGIDRDLATICETCLRKDPRRRYASAEAVADDLERWLGGEPIAARPYSGWERAVAWVRRRLALAGAMVAGGLGLLGTMTLLGTTNRSIRVARNEALASAERSRHHLIDLNVALGNELVAAGEGHAALLRFVEAIGLERGAPGAEDVHRRRFAAVLRSHARLAFIAPTEGFIYNFAFNAEGNRLVAFGADQTLRVWDTGTGELVVPPLRLDIGLSRVAFDERSERVLCLDDAGVLTWRPLDPRQPQGPSLGTVPDLQAFEVTRDCRWVVAQLGSGVRVFRSSDPLSAPVVLPDTARVDRLWVGVGSDRVVTADEDRWVRCWSLPEGQLVGPPIRSPGRVKLAALSPEGHRVAVAFQAGPYRVSIWDVATGVQVAGPLDPGTDVFDLSFSVDGKRLVLGSWDGYARVVDAVSGLPVLDKMRHRRGVSHSKYSPDGRWIATGSWDKSARLWNARTGQAASPVLHHGGYVNALAFHPKGTQLATGGADHTIRVWDLVEGSQASRVFRHGAGVRSGAFHPDGSRILTADGAGVVRIWHVADGKELHRWKHPAAVPDCHFDASGRRVLTACADGKARLWAVEDSASATSPERVFDHGSPLSEAHLSPDQSLVLTGGADGIVRVWRVADGHRVAQTAPHQKRITRARFSPDGRRIVTGSDDDTARVWDATTGAAVSAPMVHEGQVGSASFSPDGRLVLTACWDVSQVPRSAQLWDAESGTAVGAALQHLDGVTDAVFSPDGNLVATCGEDTSVRVWDAASSRLVASPLPHSGYALVVAFSPDSRLLMTSSADGITRVWDVKDGQPVTPALLHDAWVVWGCWSPDGLHLLTGSEDGTARLWDLSPATGSVEELRRQAEILSARRLDPSLGLVELSSEEIRQRWESRR